MTEQAIRGEANGVSERRDVLLDVRDLKVYFPIKSGVVFQKQVGEVKAVDGVSFTLHWGETLGLVGESGCGKTTTGRALLRLTHATAGRVFFEGVDVTAQKGRALAPFRRRAQMIFQDPYSSLDPRQTAGSIIGEPLVIHRLVRNEAELRARIVELMSVVDLDPAMASRFPHEFSGGQRQRIVIARALAVQPSLMVCDEAVAALDVSIQAQVINLLEHLQEQFNLSYLFIAHDLSVVRHISHRVAVMYLGKVVEMADRDRLYEDPLHPYTQALLAAVPVPDPDIEAKRPAPIIKGEIPSPANSPSGCVFHTRCPIAIEECKHIVPELRHSGNGHYIACLRAGNGAPFPVPGLKSDRWATGGTQPPVG